MELLRRLNQAAERDLSVPELDYDELARALGRRTTAPSVRVDLPHALELLVQNRLVLPVVEPAYSWDRGRLLGQRYRITTAGKTYLVRQVAESGRIR